jgi:hypothetical protein
MLIRRRRADTGPTEPTRRASASRAREAPTILGMSSSLVTLAAGGAASPAPSNVKLSVYTIYGK